MDFADVVRRRRMVRRYLPDPVDGGALERILATARRTPSAGFSQGQHLVVVTQRARRQAIADVCREPEHVARGFDRWLSTAPVHVVPCVRRSDYDRRYAHADKARSEGPAGWQVPFWWVDAGATLMLVLLAAVDEGLAAGFVAVPDPPALRDVLDLPGDVDPVGVITVGHPAPDRRSASLARGRRPADEVIHRERWAEGTAS